MVRNDFKFRVMKRKILMAVSASVLLAVGSCNEPQTPPSEGSRTGFALSFFKSVDKTEGKGRNIVVSPYSAGVALSMLTEGAQGETKVEFDNALNGCLFKAEPLSEGDTVIVKSANSVWVDDDFSVRNHYVSLLQKDYEALVTTLNFADPATLHAINNWCSENTGGKIKKILDSLSPQMTMVLANALYFRAPWLDQFNEKATREAVFHGVGGDQDIMMMSRNGRYNYAEYQGCQMIELPYEGGRYSMYVVLPPKGMDIESVIPYVNESSYSSALKMMAPAKVNFRLPRMRLETSLTLNNTLKKMGVQTAFTSAADFKGITAMGPLVLDTVAQKCYIDVTESGTEAAAVTVAVMALTSVRPEAEPKTMTVDRPFLFFIADKESDNILFAGKIVNL